MKNWFQGIYIVLSTLNLTHFCMSEYALVKHLQVNVIYQLHCSSVNILND
jgi:hypothetical protein